MKRIRKKLNKWNISSYYEFNNRCSLNRKINQKTDGNYFTKFRSWYSDKEYHLNLHFVHYSIKIVLNYINVCMFLCHISSKYRFNKIAIKPLNIWIERIYVYVCIRLPMAKKSIHFVESIKWYLKIIMANA